MASERSPPDIIIDIGPLFPEGTPQPEPSPEPPFILPSAEQIANIPRRLFGPVPTTAQNKDASYTYIHMQSARDADLFEDFCKDKLPADDIYVPPHLQPINPEDEDDVVPDQHAAFGIQKATQKNKEPVWKDLGLEELMARGPPGGGGGGGKAGGRRRGRGGYKYTGMPR